MATFRLLEQSQEDELHKSRLLNVEEKPFKRITKRILTPGSLISTPTKLPPTPPPDSTEGDAATNRENAEQKALEERRQFREDVLLDFAAFDSSIARIQFLRNSNARERERYAVEKLRIIDTAQEVKDNTAQLRIQLTETQATLEQRKKFDELSDKITSNRLLKPRDDQAVNLMKLEEECRELERESEAYSKTWAERREQFDRIVQEGLQMRRLIRDENEEVERREGMGEDEEDGEVGSRGGATPNHGSQSGAATPRPGGGDTPAHGELGQDEKQDGFRPRPLPSDRLSRPVSRVSSRHASPARMTRHEGKTEEDVTMDDGAGAGAADTPVAISHEAPQVIVDHPAADAVDAMDTT